MLYNHCINRFTIDKAIDKLDFKFTCIVSDIDHLHFHIQC